MEFKRYRVDELFYIHIKYSDADYNRFIHFAEKNFNNYNDNIECNLDNKL